MSARVLHLVPRLPAPGPTVAQEAAAQAWAWKAEADWFAAAYADAILAVAKAEERAVRAEASARDRPWWLALAALVGGTAVALAPAVLRAGAVAWGLVHG